MSSDAFHLHPRLAADTAVVTDWPLCRVLLMDDARYPWLVLVPRRVGLVEITDLAPTDRVLLIEETARVGAILKTLPEVAKLNIGALGNLVPQFHMHVIGRRPGDPAWPGPAWGHGTAIAYRPEPKAALLRLVTSR